jgi:hypothetical protein
MGFFNFKDFADWIPIFYGGIQTDSQGNTHDGDVMIDKAVSNFNPVIHEPPVVIGHPREDAPAFGWVEKLKAEFVDGVNTLFAQFKQLNPEFKKLVESGAYKKRSAAFYPDGTLRHVGFLGAVPPAVKGLADISFADSNFMEFEHPADGKGKVATDDCRTFSESELTAMLDQAREDGRRKERATFAERERQSLRDRQNREIERFIESRVEGGIIPPAMRDGGLVEFMQSIQDVAVFEFAEGSAKSDPLKWFMDFIDGWGKSPLFNEIATKDKVCPIPDKAAQEIQLGKEIGNRVNR